MPSTKLDGARACCDRLIRELEESDLPGAGLVSVSAGVSLHTSGQTLGDVLASAQAGVDRARALGGGRSAVRIDDGSNVTRARRRPRSSTRSRARCSRATATPASTPSRSSSSHATSRRSSA